METILNYLDNMFVNLPGTPEVLRAKEDLAEMMEDKYNELIAEGRMQNEAIGIVISEFGNIQELIDELGISEKSKILDRQDTSFVESDTMKDDFTESDTMKEGFVESGTMKKDFIKEDFAREDFKKEDLMKEDFARENFAKDNYEKKDYAKENFVKEDFVKESFGKRDSREEDSGKEDFRKEDFRKEDFRKEDSRKEDFRKKDFGKEKFNSNNTSSKYQSEMRHLSNVDAEEYLFAVKQSADKIASGVFLCICSPVLLIILTGIHEYIWPISEALAAGAGISVLLCMVACAVGLFITACMKMESYEYLKKECFTIDQTYAQTVSNIRESRKRIFTLKVASGVILCIVSVIPVIVSAMVSSELNKGEFAVIASVAALLVMVGIAVLLFITTGMEEESYKVILQEKEFSVKRKSGKKMEEIFAAIYWPCIIIIYLVWSFTSMKWGITWIIWPFAGILYDVISKITESGVREK